MNVFTLRNYSLIHCVSGELIGCHHLRTFGPVEVVPCLQVSNIFSVLPFQIPRQGWQSWGCPDILLMHSQMLWMQRCEMFAYTWDRCIRYPWRIKPVIFVRALWAAHYVSSSTMGTTWVKKSHLPIHYLLCYHKHPFVAQKQDAASFYLTFVWVRMQLLLGICFLMMLLWSKIDDLVSQMWKGVFNAVSSILFTSQN